MGVNVAIYYAREGGSEVTYHARDQQEGLSRPTRTSSRVKTDRDNGSSARSPNPRSQDVTGRTKKKKQGGIAMKRKFGGHCGECRQKELSVDRGRNTGSRAG